MKDNARCSTVRAKEKKKLGGRLLSFNYTRKKGSWVRHVIRRSDNWGTIQFREEGLDTRIGVEEDI